MEINVVAHQRQSEAGDVVDTPSLEICTKDNETYNLGQIPEETCRLVQKLEQNISDDGYAMAEQAELSIRASISLRHATFALIASNNCDAARLNNIFDLAMKYGKCMDESKLAVIEYDSACNAVLESSTIGFLYAVEGQQKRALAKFTAAGKKADDMKDAFCRVKIEISELSNEVKDMRTSHVTTRSDASEQAEAREKTIRELTRDIQEKEGRVADLDAAVNGLKSQWFPGDKPQRHMEEKANLQQVLFNLKYSKITAQSETDKAITFDQGIGCAVDALKKIEAGLQRQVSFWEAISKQYNMLVEILKELDHTSDRNDFAKLLSSPAFKYEALVTHCWFVAMRQRLKPTIRLMGECVNRFYTMVTDHPNPTDARARLQQMIEDDERNISQLLDEMRRIEGLPTPDRQQTVEEPNPTRRRTAPKEPREQPSQTPSPPNPRSAISWEQFIVRIALIVLVCFAVLVLIGYSDKPVTK